MLELKALEELEPALAARGFFGREAVVADIFLGYRLSEPQRRTAVAAPPEPCPLPALAARIREVDEPFAARGFRIGDWEPSWRADEYAGAIEAVRAAIARGGVYQVNLVQHLSAPFTGDPAGVARALRPLRPLEPRPLIGDGWAIVGASPELL